MVHRHQVQTSLNRVGSADKNRVVPCHVWHDQFCKPKSVSTSFYKFLQVAATISWRPVEHSSDSLWFTHLIEVYLTRTFIIRAYRRPRIAGHNSMMERRWKDENAYTLSLRMMTRLPIIYHDEIDASRVHLKRRRFSRSCPLFQTPCVHTASQMASSYWSAIYSRTERNRGSLRQQPTCATLLTYNYERGLLCGERPFDGFSSLRLDAADIRSEHLKIISILTCFSCIQSVRRVVWDSELEVRNKVRSWVWIRSFRIWSSAGYCKQSSYKKSVVEGALDGTLWESRLNEAMSGLESFLLKMF